MSQIGPYAAKHVIVPPGGRGAVNGNSGIAGTGFELLVEGPRPDILVWMTDEAQRILEAAMRLPDSERAVLAAILKDSLGDASAPDEIEAAWLSEVKRRMADIDSGRSTTVPWEEVKQRLHARIERARGRRASAG